MTYKQKNTFKKGFTIIEVLLISMIIALLASIILVNAGTWRLKAQKSAVLTEMSNALRAVETCMLAEYPVYCNGTNGTHTSGNNCSGQITDKPVSGSAICGDTISEYSVNDWPNLERNGYVYAGAAGSDIVSGVYTVGVYRDIDGNSIPDDNAVICCNNKGCTEEVVAANAGQYCRILANMTGLED